MVIDKRKCATIYTVFIIVVLAAVDNIVVGLFPPLFSSIARELGVRVSSLGLISAANILVTSLSAVYWGYLAGKRNRKRHLIVGTVIWSVSVFLTAYCNNFLELFILQVITGIGLGCIASIGYGILVDYIPHKLRGLLLSLWGMSQGFGGIAGAIMASLIAPASNWREPFEIVSIIGFIFIILYFFIKEPGIGEAEPELKELIEKGYKYKYSIDKKQLLGIAMKKSNIWLILQGFFMNITTGTLIWLPTLYISKIEHQGYSTQTAMIASGYLFALFQLGGLASSYLGYLGDVMQRKTYRGRAKLTAIFVFAAMPLYIAMFMLPMNKLSLPDDHNPWMILLSLGREIIQNPWMTSLFLLSFIATLAQSANTPNWLALISDVNLPEHRSTVFSLANLISGFGRTIGNAGVGSVLAIVSISANEPNNYMITLILFQLFLLPSAFCYLKMANSNANDIRRVKSTLRQRAKKSNLMTQTRTELRKL